MEGKRNKSKKLWEQYQKYQFQQVISVLRSKKIKPYWLTLRGKPDRFRKQKLKPIKI